LNYVITFRTKGPVHTVFGVTDDRCASDFRSTAAISDTQSSEAWYEHRKVAIQTTSSGSDCCCGSGCDYMAVAATVALAVNVALAVTMGLWLKLTNRNMI
jgi:hypothetical protein